ncbi:hypothetical protein PENANT_c192G05394 [Penicillium antarcticum]|uniref:Uncharacterized protein n=1 Tax=Penicillium antarcticum TaxID=416450 RepID=A0A1V6PBG1_9EURO|nr:hypothetical protein PENANT_c192G05394 [Penicillium antarcticum]
MIDPGAYDQNGLTILPKGITLEGKGPASHQTRHQGDVALGGLRHLRSEQMGQLYQTCVTPIVDYASTVWHDPLQDKPHLRHYTVQGTVLSRILSPFRAVETTVLKAEALILPTHLRLRHRAQRTIARLHSLPRDHPIWSALSGVWNSTNNVGSYASFPLAEALKTMDVGRLNQRETTDPPGTYLL